MPAILGLTHCPKPFAAMGRSYGKYQIHLRFSRRAEIIPAGGGGFDACEIDGTPALPGMRAACPTRRPSHSGKIPPSEI